MPVNGGRTVRFNPVDIGFMEALFGLVAKVEAIGTELEKKRGKTDDLAKLFDYSRASDKRMREAVDSVFGEGVLCYRKNLRWAEKRGVHDHR